jgi:hypothetical protein
LFFVATAPLAARGHVNLSPKGGDTFRVLGPLEVGYLDYTGSGAETAAHLRENGRIVIMFCAFEGSPRILRLHGQGTVITPDHAVFTNIAGRFPANLGTRSMVQVRVHRVSTSCGYAVPVMKFTSHRDALDKWALAKGRDQLAQYRKQKNQLSIDGLSAFES